MTWPQYRRREVSIDGQLYKLSPTQADIMLVLLLHRGQPVALETLIEAVWPNPDKAPEWEEQGLRTQINQMRRSRGVRCIRTCGNARWMVEAPDTPALLFAPNYENRRAA